MSALTSDRDTVRKQGEYAAYPIKGGTEIFAGSLVCIDATGNAVPGSDTAGLKFAGVSRGYVDNTSGSDGDQQVEVWRRGCFELAAPSMVPGNVGDGLYVVDDQTVGLSLDVANDVACGVVSEVNTATSVYADIGR